MPLLEKARRSPPACDVEISEEEISALLLDARNGNSASLERVFRVLQPRLHRQALFLSGDEHQALDLLQETMVEAWKHLQRYDGRASFFTWMCSIMVHRHYDWLRRIRTRACAFFASPLDENIAENARSPSEASGDLENALLVRECLDDLPRRQRTVVYLRFYTGESLEGIAAVLQCSVGTVKSRLFHALRRLARMQKLKQLRTDEKS